MKHILIIFTLFLFSLTVISCSSDSGSSTTTSTTDNTTDDDNSTTTTVSEITQTLGNDGYYSGSFEVPENGISFLLATFPENINYVGKFYSLMQSWIRGQNESVNEGDLGLTYKRGKTVKVTHKKSGKELVIIDKPNVKKEYEKVLIS